MSVEDAKVVDAIGVERESGDVVLTITDHLDWSDEQAHLLVLQEKLNTYIRFIESGEIDESYPDAVGRPRVIDVVTQHKPSAGAREFFATVTTVLREAGIALRTRVST